MNEDRIEGRAGEHTARRLDLPPGLPPPKLPATGEARGPGVPPFSEADVAALIEKNYVGLRLLVSRRCRDPHTAADLLNEAVCTTWAKWQAGKIGRPEQIA